MIAGTLDGGHLHIMENWMTLNQKIYKSKFLQQKKLNSI